MRNPANVIPIYDLESLLASHHRVTLGGIAMEIKHVHPKYADETERLERLKALNRACLEQIKRSGTRLEKTA